VGVGGRGEEARERGEMGGLRNAVMAGRQAPEAPWWPR
jgi:hypothetical protein